MDSPGSGYPGERRSTGGLTEQAAIVAESSASVGGAAVLVAPTLGGECFGVALDHQR